MTGAGKGDRYRPVDREKYGRNYTRIFSKKKLPKIKFLSV